MPRETPFHDRLAPLCTSQTWYEWSGYLAANSYDLDHMREYNAIRANCGIMDVSPLFKYHVHGRDAVRLLDRVVTRNVAKCRIGQVLYTPWCDDDGKIIDDGTLARLSEDSFRLTAAIPTLDWLQDNAVGMSVEIEDMTHEQGALSIQGPTSRGLLQKVCRADLSKLRFFHLAFDEIAGRPVRISRTGFTGDLGFEVFVDAADAPAVWDAIYSHGRSYNAVPTGNVALDVARIEAGLLLIDVDFVSSVKTFFPVQKSSPMELGLGWTVALDKGNFVGRDALRAEQARGSDWATVGLIVDIGSLEKAFARYGMPLHLPYTSWNDAIPVYADAEQREPIGRATSGTWSPVLKQYVVIARVPPRDARPGARLFVQQTIEARNFAIPAEVVKTPFFDPPRKKGLGT